MAVRVISKGPNPQVEKKITCPNCGATLAYVPNDVKERNGTDYGGGPDGVTWIDCPECSKQVTISRW